MNVRITPYDPASQLQQPCNVAVACARYGAHLERLLDHVASLCQPAVTHFVHDADTLRREVREWTTNSSPNGRRHVLTVSGPDTHMYQSREMRDLFVQGRHRNTQTIVDASRIGPALRRNVDQLVIVAPCRQLEQLHRQYHLDRYFPSPSIMRVVMETNQLPCIVIDFRTNTLHYWEDVPRVREAPLHSVVASASSSLVAANASWKDRTTVLLIEIGSEEQCEMCSICLETYEDNKEVRRLPCGHRFHRSCYDDCARQQLYRCALCQQPIEEAVDLHEQRREQESDEEREKEA